MPATGDADQRVGQVIGLRAFPVRSMDADGQRTATVLSTGLEHDRCWAVLDEAGALLTARQVPQLARVCALLPTAAGAGPQLRLPGAELAVRDASADAALSALLGQSVQVRAVPGHVRHDAPVHLVSRPGREVAAEQTRANVVLALDPQVGTERDWVGRRLRIGQVVLRLTRTPRGCPGVYADVVRPGQVAVGDPVHLLP